MAGGNDALVNLLQGGGEDQLAQFRLAEQENLQQWPRADLDVGQQSQLFHGGNGQILRLIDDQQGAMAIPVPGPELMGQALQQLAFLDDARGHAKLVGDHLEQIVRLQLGTDQIGHVDILLGQPLQQGADEGGLAGARAPGDHHEAFRPHEGVGHVGLRLGVTLVGVGKSVIRAQPERLRAEFVELLIHEDASLQSCRGETGGHDATEAQRTQALAPGEANACGNQSPSRDSSLARRPSKARITALRSRCGTSRRNGMRIRWPRQ